MSAAGPSQMSFIPRTVSYVVSAVMGGVSTVFFGVTHGADHLVGFAQGIVSRLRHGQRGVLGSYHQEKPVLVNEEFKKMLVSTESDYQPDENGIPPIFRRDFGQLDQIKWEGQVVTPTLRTLHRMLEGNYNLEGAHCIEKTLHQGLTVDFVSAVTSPYRVSNPADPKDKRVEIDIHNEGSTVVYSMTRKMVVTTTENPAEELYHYLVTWTICVPVEDLKGGKLDQATSQLTLRQVPRSVDSTSEGAITRGFRWLFSYTLDPVAMKVKEAWHSVFDKVPQK